MREAKGLGPRGVLVAAAAAPVKTPPVFLFACRLSWAIAPARRVCEIGCAGLKFQNPRLLVYLRRLEGDCEPKITLSEAQSEF
jgi:hypothetical protein